MASRIGEALPAGAAALRGWAAHPYVGFLGQEKGFSAPESSCYTQNITACFFRISALRCMPERAAMRGPSPRFLILGPDPAFLTVHLTKEDANEQR
jgi:hypothetical protein